MNRLLPALIGLGLLMGALQVQAEWVSPDGKIAFQQPSAERWRQDKAAPAPALARWVRSDGLAIVAVVQAPNPKNLPLEQSGLEEGALKQVPGAKLVSSTRTTLSGIAAYTVISSGNMGGTPRYFAQVLVAFDGQVYKLMVSSPGDPQLDAELGPMLRSLRIASASPRAPGLAFGMGSHELSLTVGQWGIGILFIAFVLSRIRKILRAPAPPSIPTDAAEKSSTPRE